MFLDIRKLARYFFVTAFLRSPSGPTWSWWYTWAYFNGIFFIVLFRGWTCACKWKIQDSLKLGPQTKLEDSRFKIHGFSISTEHAFLKLEDSRFKILLKLEDSRFKILCETWRFKIHEAWSSRVRVWGEFHILRTLVVGRGNKAYSMCTRLLLDLS